MTTIFVDAGELMARRSGSVDPSRFPDEEFELHSIPAFDAGKPEVLRGDQIGSTKQLVAPNDVMISKIVPHIRRSTIVPEFTGRRQIASSEWIVFRGPQFFPDYLRHFLTSNDFHARFMKTVSGVGGSLLRARPAEVAKIKIPLPPLAEQRRLAGLLSHAEGIVRLRREAQRKAAELVPALFLDMFGDPASNPKGWPVATLGELLAACDYGTSKKASPDDEGVPVLRMGNVSYEGDLLLDSLKHVVLDESELERQSLESGDLLFNRTNSKELVGKTGLWDGRWPAVAASYFIRLRVDLSRVLPIYVWAVMNSKDMKKRLFATARGAIGQSNINTTELKALPCAVPPIDLQSRFVARVDAVRAIAAQQAAALATAQATFDALLHRSFAVS